ncbi:PBSX family phage terminase large subunit [Anaerovibrio slackiae]|uniref:PBSX family phage terminase large subunit n=2 Tax=Anaerovibrio TaxID=82373 RepID=UPI003864E129
MELNVADLLAPVYDGLFWSVMRHRYTHYWLAGGRGSLKSSTISILAPLVQIMPENRNCHMVVMRKVGNTLRNSVYNQIIWGLEMLGVIRLYKITKSPLELTYLPTGQRILFFGTDDKTKIKSIKLPFGYVGIVWFEELDQFAGMEEIRSLNQSLLRGGERYWCFYSYNPPKSRDNWVNQEIMIEEADRMVLHTSYLQAPEEWLGRQFILEAEKLKAKNEVLYNHEYLGEVTGTGGSVFTNVEDMKMSDEMVAGFDRIYDGLDFGFTIDPLAYVKSHYDAKHEDIYIFDEIYSTGLRNSQAAEKVKPKLGGRRLPCDAAEPKSIADFRTYGIRAYGAKKGPDSVEYGIKWLQDRRKIYVDKRRAPNTYKELVSYEYQRNKDGLFVSAYPDKNNHAIDALRYAYVEVARKSGRTRLTKEALGL